MAYITVVGSFVMDNVARMDVFPAEGQTVLGSSLELFPGGKGANQCVAAARLGGRVAMAGMLGADANGEAFRAILREEGINADRVFTCEKPTAVAQVQINRAGQNRICVIPSANYEFGLSELDAIEALLAETSLLVLQLELRLDVTEELIRRAHARGIPILLNPAPAAALSEEVLSCVEWITPNETELAVLSGLPVETEEELTAAARSLLARGVKHVVATLGSRGALLADESGCELIEGYPVKAVDTVAAGDSFNGALAVALTEGKPLREAVKFANAVGALTVQKRGAIPSLCTRRELERFMAKN